MSHVQNFSLLTVYPSKNVLHQHITLYGHECVRTTWLLFTLLRCDQVWSRQRHGAATWCCTRGQYEYTLPTDSLDYWMGSRKPTLCCLSPVTPLSTVLRWRICQLKETFDSSENYYSSKLIIKQQEEKSFLDLQLMHRFIIQIPQNGPSLCSMRLCRWTFATTVFRPFVLTCSWIGDLLIAFDYSPNASLARSSPWWFQIHPHIPLVQDRWVDFGR